MAMIFQDPRASINPVRTCGDQLREVLHVSRGVDHRGEPATVMRTTRAGQHP